MKANGTGSIRRTVRLVADTLRYPLEATARRTAMAEADRLSYEAASVQFREIARRIQPDPDEIELALHGDSSRRDLDPETHAELQQMAVQYSLRNPHCVGYLQTMRNFVIGEGPTIECTNEDITDAEKALLAENWKRFCRVNRWEDGEDELPQRAWRDGEYFLRFFEHIHEGPPDNWRPSPKVVQALQRANRNLNFDVGSLEPEPIPAGTLLVRFVPAEHIADPSGSVPHGILTAEEDVVTVLGYCYAPGAELTDTARALSRSGVEVREIIPARDVLHRKIRVDQDVLRGRSLLEPLLKPAQQFEKWVGYRMVLNLARSAVVLLKKFTSAAPGQVGSVRDQQASQRNDPTNDRRQRALKAGTVAQVSGIEYEYLAPNLQAQDARHDGRSLALLMCAASGMAEYVMTGDASNSNYASTMVAESPMVRAFEHWQDTFGPDYCEVYRRAALCRARHDDSWGIDEERIEALDFRAVFPPMIHRDEKATAERDEILNRVGSKSAETIADEHGLTWDTERSRLRREAEDAIDFIMPMMSGPGGPDGGGDE